MNGLRKHVASGMAWLIAIQTCLITIPAIAAPSTPEHKVALHEQMAIEKHGVELRGEFVDKVAQLRAEKFASLKPGFAEDGAPMDAGPFANLPIVDDALLLKAKSANESDNLRVIVHLIFLPHAQVVNDVLSAHQKDINALEASRIKLKKELDELRRKDTTRDSENYGLIRKLNDSQRAATRALAEENERISLVVKNEVSAQLRTLIDDSQHPINNTIERLGGTVEFGTIAGNTIVALMPPAAIEELAKEEGILRIVEDSLMEGHLTTADDSTMVDPADTSLLGLWDFGLSGGLYDPAIIDSGTTLNHPGLQNSVSPERNNFSSWYQVSAITSSAYAESCCSINDAQGHGTHVAGIVGSYGTGANPGHLGMAHGVDKLITLKAGWLNTSGTTSMFWSDKYHLVDRALYASNLLTPANTFTDDVDGMNLSYGVFTSLDDTDGGRFWDSVISTYPDLAVTVSAGNTGPFNTFFSDPAVSYNAIAVANYSDRGTPSRDDDVVNTSSTVGPTANGRKKPDIAAPGTSIAAPNNDWATEVDYIDKSGTSMAAPMVLGVAMDLMDAGLLFEIAIKAVLINTAQKNLPGMNFENDFDGWDPQLGWGAMNALAAYHHRGDYFNRSVAPRGTAGDFKLFKGVMRDEGASGEGRDKATMVWHRVATYNPDADPTTYYSLSDLNLRLYDESNNSLIDSDFDSNDNVHQVRIGSGAAETDVVISAYAWSQAFDHGGATQPFVLATEEDFVEVDFPTNFQGIAVWPGSVEPNEVFNIEFLLRNDSDVASHNNVYNLTLPAGFTLISGLHNQNTGSLSAGDTSAQVNYTIKAPATVISGQNIVVEHSHTSYNESYGTFNWGINVNVVIDETPPTPNPMSFSVPPAVGSTTSLTMTASLASDIHDDPIQYYLEALPSPTGGAGASDSGWQNEIAYTDSGLESNHKYCYRASARDSALGLNETNSSAASCAYTRIVEPNGVNFTNVTSTSIGVTSVGVFNNLNLDLSGVMVRNTTDGTDSGWQQNTNQWSFFGLAPATPYTFDAASRNGDGITTEFVVPDVKHTLANPPAVDALVTSSDTEIMVQLNPNGNGNLAEYLVQNTSNGTDSGWTSDTTTVSGALTCDTSYNFQARARNGEGIETLIVPLGSQSTAACAMDTDNDGVPDADDNCTLVSNTDQRDTNGDGYGNICDPDLNNDGLITFADISLWVPFFGMPTTGDEDFDGDGNATFGDYALFPLFFLQPPGPSGIAP